MGEKAARWDWDWDWDRWEKERQWWLLSPGSRSLRFWVTLGVLTHPWSGISRAVRGSDQKRNPFYFQPDEKPMASPKFKYRNSWGYCFLVYSLMFAINYRTEYLCTHCYILLWAFYFVLLEILGAFCEFRGRAAAVDVSFFSYSLNWCASASLAYLKTLSVNCCDKSKKRENIANECGRREFRTDEGHRCVWVTLRRRPNETSWA